MISTAITWGPIWVDLSRMTPEYLKFLVSEMALEDKTAEANWGASSEDRRALMPMGRRVWTKVQLDTALWVLDRMVFDRPGKPPKTRLLKLTSTTTKEGQPGVWFYAEHLRRYSGGGWVSRGITVTEHKRFGAIWTTAPTHAEYAEMSKRIRLAAQLGQWINPPLPEGFL